MESLRNSSTRRIAIALCVVVMFVLGTRCDDSPPTSPGPGPTTSIPAPPPPPPHNPGPDFTHFNTRGLLRFPIIHDSEGEIHWTIQRFRSAWPDKDLVINMCSEVAEWSQTPWCDGPPAYSPQNLDALRRFLKLTASEGVYVRLNIFCTVRDNHAWMNDHWREYTRTIANIAKEYNHVFLSVANEPYHPDSWLRAGRRVRDVRDVARQSGFRGPMGADDTIGPPGAPRREFDYEYALLDFTPDFHPWRWIERGGRQVLSVPGPSDFDRMVTQNGIPLLISEPIAYSTSREGGCCTEDRNVILAYFRQAERRGITMYFHSTYWGLECLGTNPNGDSWIPIP